MTPRRLYSLVVFLLLPWALLHLLWRARRQADYLRHWNERFARFAPRPAQPPTLWIHAVSVGETRAAQPLIAALRRDYPGHRLLLSHMTPTGRATATALYGDSIESIYLPYDTPGAVKRFLAHVRPSLGLIMETELWPNLVAGCKAAKVPLYLVNGRLSARSARRYARFPRLTAEALGNLAGVMAQSVGDAERLRTLGARHVDITGNLKFDCTVPDELIARGAQLRQGCGTRPVWLAASTREGEEALILDAWRDKLGAGEAAPDERPLLVLVPRHPQRFEEVAKLIAARGFSCQRRSTATAIAADTDVLLGDSMGEMFAYYAMSDLAFIGGSLLDYGAQNLIEACAVGTPVLIGPSTRNFAEATAGATTAGAALAIADAKDLVGQVQALLADSARRAAMAQAGRTFAAAHRGATARTLARLKPAST